MKRLGLGLAALAAVGAISPACAASLEDAIKGVETSGFVRFKYLVKDKNGSEPTIEDYRLSAQINFTAPIEDDFYVSASFSGDHNDKPATSASEPIAGYDAASNRGLYNDRLYFQYKTDAVNAKLGKLDPYTPWTETGFNASRGNGLVAQYTGLEDWTFVGNAFVQTNGFDDTNVLGGGVGAINGQGGSEHNLYALGVVGSFSEKIGLDAQVWAGKYENIVDSMIFANLRYKIDSFYVRAQAAATTLDEGFQTLAGFTDDTGVFAAGEIGFRNSDFFLRANYTQTDKDQPFYALDGDNDGFIKHGTDLYYYTTNIEDTGTLYISGGFSIDKWALRAGYGAAKSGEKGFDATISELHAVGAYKFTPKFDAQLTLATFDGDDVYPDYDSATFQILYVF